MVVLLPVLLSVAFMTIIERKQLAAMQRRVGPNTVGQINIKNSFGRAAQRSYHSLNQNKILSELYLHRKAPIIPFKDKIVSVCEDLTSSIVLNKFFKDLEGSSGIYMFTWKIDPSIYYIGRAKDFQKRFKSHLNIKLNDRFHTFANAVGWDKFEFSIVELCNLDVHLERENYYLQKYLPLLNTIFKSNLGKTQTFESLYELLKLKQLDTKFENKHKGLPINLYEHVNGQFCDNYTTFNSINQLSKHLNISRETISIYLNTYVPYKEKLFLTVVLDDAEILNKLVSDAILGLDLNPTSAKKVWVYCIEADNSIVKTTFDSIGLAAKSFNVHHTFINTHLDKWITGGIEGNYLFSNELGNLEIDKLLKISLLRKHNNLKVWSYDAKTLELITDAFRSIQKAADFFNVDYRSIQNHLDTKTATIKGGKLVLFFSKELTDLEKVSLINTVKKATNETTPVWVYKLIENKLELVNSDLPSYKSKLMASKSLKMSVKTIEKYLDSGNPYKELYFYSFKI